MWLDICAWVRACEQRPWMEFRCEKFARPAASGGGRAAERGRQRQIVSALNGITSVLCNVRYTDFCYRFPYQIHIFRIRCDIRWRQCPEETVYYWCFHIWLDYFLMWVNNEVRSISFSAPLRTIRLAIGTEPSSWMLFSYLYFNVYRRQGSAWLLLSLFLALALFLTCFHYDNPIETSARINKKQVRYSAFVRRQQLIAITVMQHLITLTLSLVIRKTCENNKRG